MTTYYDIHCHIFNKDVIIRRLVNVVQSLLAIKDLVDKDVTSAELKFKIDGINRTLEEVTQESSEDVFEALDKVYRGNVVTTPLMFDLTYADDNDDDENQNKRYRKRIKRVFWLLSVALPFIKRRVNRKIKSDELAEAFDKIKDNVKKFEDSFARKSDEEVEIFDNANYAQQIADLEYLAEKYETIKPFFSIDPRREYKGSVNLVDKLKEKIVADDGKFTGVKLYAPAGFSPTDPVLMGTSNSTGIYALCQEHNIPITVHNSNGGFACLSSVLKVRGDVLLNGNIVKPKKPLVFDERFFSRKVHKAIAERAKKLNHPQLWELVMKKFPNLTINFAHFGGSTQIMDYINYNFPDEQKRVDEEEFEDAIMSLSDKNKAIIRKAYTLNRRKRILRDDLTIAERAEVWNALYRTGFIDNWAKAIFDIIKNPKYPNAYTDLSCFSEGTIIESPDSQDLIFSIRETLSTFKNSFFDKLSDYEKSKILYGSDYYLTQFFGPSMEQYFSDFKLAFGDDFETIASINPKKFLNL
ncbi:amidohydrolase family protein [uncultured Draconibacterium sp.]|uniref:amidohydrolase family protein n=1 Tax=uncultured Draconibacterium sp. TaxID=1573823 RepID=UPI0029C7FFB5|nr:amidohydrolase family protein [uncultured Draconibacterium sp.]